MHLLRTRVRRTVNSRFFRGSVLAILLFAPASGAAIAGCPGQPGQACSPPCANVAATRIPLTQNICDKLAGSNACSLPAPDCGTCYGACSVTKSAWGALNPAGTTVCLNTTAPVTTCDLGDGIATMPLYECVLTAGGCDCDRDTVVDPLAPCSHALPATTPPTTMYFKCA
jgi:hypothetical protein